MRTYVTFFTCLFFVLALAQTQSIESTDGKVISHSNLVDELISKMTIEEKIGQLNLLTPGGAVTGEVVSKNVAEKIRNGNVGGIFGVRGADKMRQMQSIAVDESRLGIPLITGLDVIHGHRTITPIPLGLSASWDLQLIEEVARMAAREATAEGIMWNFSPMVDISREPRWGRTAEGAGEDPFLGAQVAAAMVQGYQGSDISAPTTMLACVKHFAAYGASEGGRDYATVDMSKIRLYNEYLPPYKAAVDAGVGSVMSSFNVLDYMPVSASKELTQDILRNQWGFDGFVVTDYTAMQEMIEHGVGNLEEVSALALKSGIDMDMVDEGYVKTLQQSLAKGRITEEDIDRACRRILEAKEKLGLFQDPYLYFDSEREKKELLSDENRELARKAAAASFVLLKNENNILPLRSDTKVALIGPLADSRRNMLGTWSVSGDHTLPVTVMEGFYNKVDSNLITYAKGSNISDDPVFAKRVNAFGPEIVIDDRDPSTMIEEAIQAAQSADVIVAVMGEAADMSGESSSMADISLQPCQKRLLKELEKLEKPIVMLLYNGRPMTLEWENKNIDAIMDVWFGGIEGGNAIADVIYGDVNPGGRLTISFPIKVGQIPVYHSMLNTGRPDYGKRAKFKSNYLDVSNEPLYPFGYGLGYTTFEYGIPVLSDTILTAGKSTNISIEITNSGKRDGSEVVQMYIRDVVGSISRPMKELKGFEKIHLASGETRQVTFTINVALLKFYNSHLEYIAEPGAFEVMIGPNSSETQSASFHLR